MRNRQIGVLGAFLWMLSVSSSTRGQAPVLVTAAPGSADIVVEATSCPTFSWSHLAFASSYRLEVYSLEEIDASENPVLVEAFPAGVSSWTPSQERCLESGEYGWTMLARVDDEDVKADPRFFAVMPLPSNEEVLHALDVLRRFEAVGIGDVGFANRARVPDSDSHPLVPRSRASERGTSSVTAAMTGEALESTGESFGLQGLSQSPDGAGIRAENTSGSANAADLLLVDTTASAASTQLNETSLTRDSPSTQFFDFRNPGAGDLILMVDGEEVLTTATDQNTTYSAGNQLSLTGTTFNVNEGSGSGLDADTLDGANGTAFAPASHSHNSADPSLDDAYDGGGAGAGRTITVDAGPIELEGDDGFVAKGTLGSGSIPAEGDGTRMMWYPGKAAFRAGFSLAGNWDDPKIGLYSAAFGRHTEASGEYSFALGQSAAAFGRKSFAAGAATRATGVESVALGVWSESQAAGSLVAGRYNVIAGSSLNWFPSEPLFVLGNGTGSATRSNAFTVLKNGKTGINTASPTAMLDVRGDVRIKDGAEGAGKVLTSDEDGFATWQAATSGPVPWATLLDVPIGLDDGDDDTQYSAGPGLDLVGTEFRTTLGSSGGPRPNQTWTIAAVSAFAGTPSLIRGGDGRPFMAFKDASGGLSVAHCNASDNCASSSVQQWDASSDVKAISVTLGMSAAPLVSYVAGGDLRVLSCTTPSCDQASITTPANAGVPVLNTSIVVGDEGYPWIAYDTASSLELLLCSTSSCSDSPVVVDAGTGSGSNPSLARGTNGRAIISYLATGSLDLRFASCSNPTCSTVNVTTLDSAGAVGFTSSLSLSTGGFPVISYVDLTDDDLLLAVCEDTECSLSHIANLSSGSPESPSASTGLVVSEGLPAVVYVADDQLRFMRCRDADCAQSQRVIVDNTQVPSSPSLILLDGSPAIAYLGNGSLNLTFCGGPWCTPYWAPRGQ